MIRRIRWWDLAGSDARKTRSDWTVGAKMARTASGLFVIEHVVRGRWSPTDRDRLILETARSDGLSCPVGFEEDPGQAGKSQTAALARLLAGFAAHFVRPTGDKATRATPFASQVGAGNVVMLRGPWNKDVLSELGLFPRGKHDDIVDALSGAFNHLARSLGGPSVPRAVGRRRRATGFVGMAR